MNRLPFQPPFHVQNGEILDAGERRVSLWGVNYYAPFNHNFYNIAELGKDPLRAIDTDLDHLQLLGTDFLRLHMYEREITNPAGELVENANLRVFDYLVDQCEKRGIFLMIAPISYWNSVQNLIEQERLYAYWNIGAQEAFGFTNSTRSTLCSGIPARSPVRNGISARCSRIGMRSAGSCCGTIRISWSGSWSTRCSSPIPVFSVPTRRSPQPI